MSYLGIEPDGARRLGAETGVWSRQLDEVITDVLEAEQLAQIPTSVVGRLDEISLTGRAVAASLNRAADEAESFTLRLDRFGRSLPSPQRWAWAEGSGDHALLNRAGAAFNITGSSDAETERRGETSDEAHLRALAGEMSNAEAADIASAHFAVWAGGDQRLQMHELASIVRDHTVSDDVRAAALRLVDVFEQVDVARDSDLAAGLASGNGFELWRTDGDVSLSDLATWPAKHAHWVTLSPWTIFLDVASEGGRPDGRISTQDLFAFVAHPDVPTDVKLAALEVFGDGDGGSAALLAPVALRLPSSSGVGMATSLHGSSATATGGAGAGAGVAASSGLALVVGAMIGWEVGGVVRDHVDADPATHISLVEPDTGRVVPVSLEVIEQYPPHAWPQVIDAIASGEPIPTPVELDVADPPDTYRDANGVLRDSHTGDEVNERTAEADSYGRHLAALQRISEHGALSRPSVTDAVLAAVFDELYRPGATLGSGSTADAVRYEQETGTLVGGRGHEQKARERIRQLERWLRKTRDASESDQLAAKAVIDDLRRALDGN